MKKILGICIGLFILSSCDTKNMVAGVINATGTKEKFFIKVDSSEWEIKYVYLNNNGIYILVPTGSNVSIRKELPESITYSNGKSTNTVIKIK